MGLEELNEDIYKRDYASSRDMKTAYDPGEGLASSEGLPFSSQEWQVTSPVKKGKLASVYRFFFGSGRRMATTVSMLFLCLCIAALPFIRSWLFDAVNITVAITGPKNVASAETVKYSFVYSNKNILGLKDAELMISFPDSFKAEGDDRIPAGNAIMTVPLGAVSGRSGGSVEVAGRFYGSKGELVYPKATLRYTPASIGSAFETSSQIGVSIVSSPLALDITVPQEIASGNEVTYTVEYRNDSDIAFSGLRIKAEYPSGFHFSGADPATAEGDTVWKIGNILPHGSGSIRIRGTLTGSRDQAKVFRVAFGVVKGDDTFLAYDQSERVTRMVAPPLSVTQTVNSQTDISVHPGSRLIYQLRYANDGAIGLRDVIVTTSVDPANLDMASLSLGNKGSYDASRSIIIWNASDLPELSRLEPGQGGSVSFSVFVRKDIGTSGTAGKDLTVRTKASIDSPDIPLENKIVSSNVLETKIGTVAFFDVNGYYFDAAVPNTGPIPPKVGQETTYTIHLVATNFLNDLGQMKVTAVLPTGVKYLGKKSSDAESVEYNDRSGTLVWNIGNMQGGGKSIREFVFQVAVVPGPNEIGISPNLLRSAVLEAQDSFTNNPIRIEKGVKTTALLEDTSLAPDAYRVSAN
jgi:hypothetical protein